MRKLSSMCALLCAFGWSGSVLSAPDARTGDAPVVPRESSVPSPTDNHFYLNGGVGLAGVNLTTFRAAEQEERFTAGLFPTRGRGFGADAGAGLRLAIATLGLRGSVIALDVASSDRKAGTLELWSLDAELGLHMPVGRLEPHLTLAAGYSTLGGVGELYGIRRGLDVDGANARVGLGLQYYASQHVSVGVRATGELLFLSRDSVPVRDLARMQEVGTISEARARILQGNGATAGTAYMILVGPGIHF